MLAEGSSRCCSSPLPRKPGLVGERWGGCSGILASSSERSQVSGSLIPPAKTKWDAGPTSTLGVREIKVDIHFSSLLCRNCSLKIKQIRGSLCQTAGGQWKAGVSRGVEVYEPSAEVLASVGFFARSVASSGRAFRM